MEEAKPDMNNQTVNISSSSLHMNANVLLAKAIYMAKPKGKE